MTRYGDSNFWRQNVDANVLKWNRHAVELIVGHGEWLRRNVTMPCNITPTACHGTLLRDRLAMNRVVVLSSTQEGYST